VITPMSDECEKLSWTASGLVLEAHRPFADRIAVVVRDGNSPAVLWDGEFPAEGRSIPELCNEPFTVEVLARVTRDLSERLGRFVYTQDEIRCAVRDFAAALPETFRP
jgi:hypothetical protein